MSSSSLTTVVNRLSQALRQQVLPVIGRLPGYGKLLYALVTEPDLPLGEKRALLFAIGYQVSPVDLIPGFIPVIGALDDLLVMLWGIRTTLDRLPAERADALLAGANLTRAQIDADAAVVRRALSELVSRGTRAAGRGLLAVVKGAVTAGTYVGYLAYYLAMRRGTRR